MNNEVEWKLPLRNIRKEIIGYTIVDEDDFHRLKDYRWCFSKKYASNWKLGYMHRYIMNAPKNSNLTVDHKNNNKLDNRKCNLYLATKQEQSQNKKIVNNTANYIGVTWDKRWKRWRVQSCGTCIGYWDNEKHAAWAYDQYVLTNMKHPKTNGIDKPTDFIEWQGKKIYNELTGVYYHKKNNKWTSRVGSKYRKLSYKRRSLSKNS